MRVETFWVGCRRATSILTDCWVDASVRALARELYEGVADAPIISPHGHVSAQLLAENRPFADPAELFVTPDHYVTRLLHSSGVPLEALGVAQGCGAEDAAP